MVVAEGDTFTLPLVGSEPMPLSIDTEVASLVDHVNVELWPGLMRLGLAENEMVGGGVLTTVKYSDCLMMRPALSQSCTTRYRLPAAKLALALIWLPLTFFTNVLST